MNLLLRYKYHLTAMTILFAALLAGTKTKVTVVTEEAQDLPRVESTGQLTQALELLTAQQAAELHAMEVKGDVRAYILETVRRSLPVEYRPRAFEIARSLIVEANHHDMDPLFLMAVVAHESKFKPKARGFHGEIGLMQILLSTAAEIAPQAGVSKEMLNLEDPAINIRIGTTYFSQLRKRFKNHGTRYVSAYNMGTGNVRKLLAQKIEPMIYNNKVMAHYTSYYGQLEVAARGTAVASRSIASVE
jgi:soluble lytic murein transglycosylase-like protein